MAKILLTSGINVNSVFSAFPIRVQDVIEDETSSSDTVKTFVFESRSENIRFKSAGSWVFNFSNGDDLTNFNVFDYESLAEQTRLFLAFQRKDNDKIDHFAIHFKSDGSTYSYYKYYHVDVMKYTADLLTQPDHATNIDIIWSSSMVTGDKLFGLHPLQKDGNEITIDGEVKTGIIFLFGVTSTTGRVASRSYFFIPTDEYYITDTPAPTPTDRGYYHGLPDSLLYQRQFIRGGINYLRNIDIYDETYQPVNSAFLSNRVGTLTYNGIEFAYPYIRVKARTDLLFTHVVTASWSADNRPVVYKVINYKCLGGDLNEYTLRVDGLKTYFQYHGITTSSPVCLRHTNSANWNKWIQDTVPYDGTYSYMKLTGTAVTYLVCLVVNGNAYAMTKNHFNAFCGSLMAREDQEKIINQISNVFVVPYTSSNDCYNPATEITFTDSSFTATADYWMPDYGNIQGQLQTEALKPIQDQSYVYDSNAKIHFPCYGDVNAPYDFIINLSQSPQQVKYRISFIDGTCSVSTYPFIFWSPAVGLPQKSIPFDSSKVSLYNINKNQQAGIGNIITSALGGAVAGAVAGVKAGGVGAVAGAIVGAVGSGGIALMNNNTTADAQRDIVANSQGIHSVASTGGSSMADPNISISFLIPNLATNYPDYYKVVGYPVQKPLKDCVTSSGDVIWLNFNIPELKDNREIVEDLYKASQEGIFWNA